MQSIPQRSIPPRPPDPSAVMAFLSAGKSTDEAATYFGVTERSVRRIRQRQHSQGRAAVAVEHTVRPTGRYEPPSGVEASTVSENAPQYATVQPTAVARDETLWKCPMCGELMPPIPGTTGVEWATSGCYLCAVRLPYQVDHNVDWTPDSNARADTDRTPDSADIVAGGHSDSGQASEASGMGKARTALSNPPYIIVQERVRFVRVPIEQPPAGVFAWMQGEVFSPGPMLALLAVGFLIMLCMILGG